MLRFCDIELLSVGRLIWVWLSGVLVVNIVVDSSEVRVCFGCWGKNFDNNLCFW